MIVYATSGAIRDWIVAWRDPDIHWLQPQNITWDTFAENKKSNAPFYRISLLIEFFKKHLPQKRQTWSLLKDLIDSILYICPNEL